MTNRVRAAVLTLMAGAATAVPFPAGAATGECAGQTATIVGTPGEVLAGTAGPDVIVTNGAPQVDSGGGDDVVCATEMPSRSYVFAGAGDDSVVAQPDGYKLFKVDLGPGDDRFEGGAGRDFVDTFDPLDEAHRDDVVSTGRGADRVRVTRPVGPATNDADRVDLGPGDDWLSLGDSGLAPEAEVVGGAGRDLLEVNSDNEDTDVVIDARARTIMRGGPYLSGWASFESYFVKEFGQLVTFVGSSDSEHVRVVSSRFVASMGGGRDEVTVISAQQRGELRGGGGRDRVIVQHMGASKGPWIDLARGLAGSNGSEKRARFTLAGFEDATAVYGDQPLVVGDAKANSLVAGCGTVRGGGGADRIVETYPAHARGPVDFCDDFVALGGPGNDVLTGSAGPDVLLGGQGRDQAIGLAGRDRCEAEVRLSC